MFIAGYTRPRLWTVSKTRCTSQHPLIYACMSKVVSFNFPYQNFVSIFYFMLYASCISFFMLSLLIMSNYKQQIKDPLYNI